MNENVKKMIEEKKEEILERAIEMYRSSLNDHNEHMLCLSSDGYLYGHEGSGTPIGVYNGDDICVFQCQSNIDNHCDFAEGVKYLLDPDQLELLEDAKSWAESKLDFDDIETWQELFPDRFELSSNEESMLDEALEGKEHVNELQIWQELFPEKFILTDEEQRKMDIAVEINNSHMDEEKLIEKMFPDEWQEMEEREREDVDNKRAELEEEMEGQLGDEIAEFLLSNGLVDENTTSNDEVVSLDELINKREEMTSEQVMDYANEFIEGGYTSDDMNDIEDHMKNDFGITLTNWETTRMKICLEELEKIELSQKPKSKMSHDEVVSLEELTNNQEQIVSRIKNGERVCTWSVQNEEGDDDIFNGTLEECKDYIKESHRDDLVRVALIQLDENLGFDYCHDSIEIDDLDLDISENDNACSDEVEEKIEEKKTSINDIKQAVKIHREENRAGMANNVIHSR